MRLIDAGFATKSMDIHDKSSDWGLTSGLVPIDQAFSKALKGQPNEHLHPHAHGTHAVRIGNDVKISGAVSMDDAGNPIAEGDLAQQMKNCYADLEKVLKHYGCTFDDVIVENIFTTDMAEFLKHSAYRNSIYTKQFPTGSWLEVKGLALPEFMIEIELEAHKAN
jgi:enamine deaminase RidA (YjgF/YER057c/UK114 family)